MSAKRKKPKRAGRPDCRGKTNAGKPCGNKAAAGSMYCAAHGGGKRRIGRKGLLDEDMIAKVVDVVRLGVTWDVAAQAAGIDISTLHGWRRTGADDIDNKRDTVYAHFVEQLTRATAQAETVLVGRINAASLMDWKAAMAILERRHPERWARRDHLDVDVGDRAKPRDVKPVADRRDDIITILTKATASPQPSDN